MNTLPFIALRLDVVGTKSGTGHSRPRRMLHTAGKVGAAAAAVAVAAACHVCALGAVAGYAAYKGYHAYKKHAAERNKLNAAMTHSAHEQHVMETAEHAHEVRRKLGEENHATFDNAMEHGVLHGEWGNHQNFMKTHVPGHEGLLDRIKKIHEYDEATAVTSDKPGMRTFREHVKEHHTSAKHQQMYMEHQVEPPTVRGHSIFEAAMKMASGQRNKFLESSRKEAQRLHQHRELADHKAQLALSEMHTDAATSKGIDAREILKHKEIAVKAREKASQIATRQKQVHGNAIATHVRKIEDLTRSLENAKTDDERTKLSLKL